MEWRFNTTLLVQKLTMYFWEQLEVLEEEVMILQANISIQSLAIYKNRILDKALYQVLAKTMEDLLILKKY